MTISLFFFPDRAHDYPLDQLGINHQNLAADVHDNAFVTAALNSCNVGCHPALYRGKYALCEFIVSDSGAAGFGLRHG